MFDSQHTQKMEQPKFHRAGLLGLWKRKNRVSFKLIKKPKKKWEFLSFSIHSSSSDSWLRSLWMSALVETVFWSSFRVPPLSSWRCCYCCYTTVAGRENWTAVRGRSSLAKHGVRLKFPTSSSFSCVCVFCLIFLALFFGELFLKNKQQTQKRERNILAFTLSNNVRKKTKQKQTPRVDSDIAKVRGGKGRYFKAVSR